MKSESGFSFAIASQPFEETCLANKLDRTIKKLQYNIIFCPGLLKGWLAIAKLKPLSLFISLF